MLSSPRRQSAQLSDRRLIHETRHQTWNGRGGGGRGGGGRQTVGILRRRAYIALEIFNELTVCLERRTQIHAGVLSTRLILIHLCSFCYYHAPETVQRSTLYSLLPLPQ